MFTSVRIQNFRQFRDLELKNLGRINLITGQNNTGKTSLLEALALHLTPTNPDAVLTISNQRGMSTIVADGPNPWGWIFRTNADSGPITITSVDSTANRAVLNILTSQGLQVPRPPEQPGIQSPGTRENVITTSGKPLHSLVFEYEDSHGQRGLSRLRLENDRTTVEREGGEVRIWPSAFLANRPTRAAYPAQALSRLIQANLEDEVTEALRVVDSRLDRLRVLDTGTGSTVFADFGTGWLVPLQVVGQGFARTLLMVAAIIEAANGVVLIDEIEDGLHYSVLPAVWKAISAAAIKHDVQIFATTHSLEAIEAAVEATEGHEGSLAFYRLDRVGSDIEVVEGSDSRLRSAVRVGAEIR